MDTRTDNDDDDDDDDEVNNNNNNNEKNHHRLPPSRYSPPLRQTTTTEITTTTTSSTRAIPLAASPPFRPPPPLTDHCHTALSHSGVWPCALPRSLLQAPILTAASFIPHLPLLHPFHSLVSSFIYIPVMTFTILTLTHSRSALRCLAMISQRSSNLTAKPTQCTAAAAAAAVATVKRSPDPVGLLEAGMITCTVSAAFPGRVGSTK
ncbi:hypothetical protein E2C01_025120 [Portunus trituberculatus]|uniref:Uncharacterized protein n=1 Tax=Portunus trituberculatus TaxID=210409 RepID=A0A5B7ECB2_PORTR|nr:hypothetical protein [Portunus trituberculatus]